MRSLIVIITLILASCSGVGNKAKEVINKTGEVVGEGSSEFVKGVSKGVDNTFETEITLSDALKQSGVAYGKYSIIKGAGSDGKNVLSVYLIFNKDFSSKLSAKVFDNSGKEYGRTSLQVSAKKDEARYIDFIFDNHTDVERKSKFIIE